MKNLNITNDYNTSEIEEAIKASEEFFTNEDRTILIHNGDHILMESAMYISLHPSNGMVWASWFSTRGRGCFPLNTLRIVEAG